MTGRARSFLAALMLLAPAAGSAQAVPTVEPGTRVRVTLAGPTLRREIGTWKALTDTTLQLDTGANPIAIPLAVIERIERSAGRRRSLAGGIAGFVIGAAAGGAAGCLANRDDYGVFCGGQSDTKVVAGAAIGAVAGAALGAVLFGGERWTAVER